MHTTPPLVTWEWNGGGVGGERQSRVERSRAAGDGGRASRREILSSTSGHVSRARKFFRAGESEQDAHLGHPGTREPTRARGVHARLHAREVSDSGHRY
eukprot:30920-Pelagococcus_subviridis.AAC.17